ncbi:hypothetical protein [Poriferisphaera sp. WC338]|uniref:hypothetical protein n=1 Tax=Poriferisphaera sp. WC338 TaxID=3425129 RepID=UPI003D817D01
MFEQAKKIDRNEFGAFDSISVKRMDHYIRMFCFECDMRKGKRTQLYCMATACILSFICDFYINFSSDLISITQNKYYYITFAVTPLLCYIGHHFWFIKTHKKAWLINLYQQRPIAYTKCVNCDYNLSNINKTSCPECGWKLPVNEYTELNENLEDKEMDYLENKYNQYAEFEFCLVISITMIYVLYWLGFPTLGKLLTDNLQALHNVAFPILLMLVLSFLILDLIIARIFSNRWLTHKSKIWQAHTSQS